MGPLALGGAKLWPNFLVPALLELPRGAALWGKRLELPAEPGAGRGAASGLHSDLLMHTTFGGKKTQKRGAAQLRAQAWSDNSNMEHFSIRG